LLNTLPLTHPPNTKKCVKALKIKGLTHTEKLPKSYRKATENSKLLKIKDLMNFFSVFRFYRKDPPTKPANPPVRWHDFCSQKHDFFYTFLCH